MKLISVVALLGLAAVCQGLVEPTDIPPELETCLHTYGSQTNDTMEVEANCFDQFVWKTHRIRWADYNVTEADLNFLKSLSGSFLHERRVRRTPIGPLPIGQLPMGPPPIGPPIGTPIGHPRVPIGPLGIFPTTGFRVRREIRRLTDQERSAFFKAVNIMKTRRQYDLFAIVHSGIVIRSAHFGPNFMGWHRIFLTMFEEALRRINPRVSLPYWDTTFDFHMEEAVTSIMWSPLFVGNGDGFVRTGPFAGWRHTNNDRLLRNINNRGSLLSRPQIRQILSRCRNIEIVYPTAAPTANFDLLHGGTHNWVGGQMMGLETAAADPIFFMYHAFIDYVWELFRIRQATVCGINPSTDIPFGVGLHNRKRPMDGFPEYRGGDGYSDIWTKAWYRYERSPSCSYKGIKCGSPYLRCDMPNQACISVSAPVVDPGFGGGAVGGAAGYGAGSGSAGYAATAARSEAEERTVRIGRTFPSPPSDERTSSVRLGRGRVRRSAVHPSSVPAYNVPTEERPTENELSFTHRTPSETLPLPLEFANTQFGSSLRPPAENTYMIDGVYDRSAWVYMPVKIASLSSTFSSQYLNLNGQSSIDNAQCKPDVSGAMQVIVQSQGINYSGTYAKQALIDTKQPVSVTVTYIAVKHPKDQASDVLIFAYGACSQCQAKCLVPGSSPAQYKPCEGAVKLTNKAPLMFDKTVEGAAAIAWTWTGHTLEGRAENIPLVFICA